MPTPLIPIARGKPVQTKPMSHPPLSLWNQLGWEQQMQLAQQWARLIRQVQRQNASMEKKDVKG